MDRHPAPAGADLEQVVGRTELERVADPLEADVLGALERLVAGLVVGARVHHRLAVEEELEHVVAEVVVGGDVGAGAGAGVQHPERREPLEGEQQRRDPAPQRVGAADVAGGDPQQPGKVVGVPEALGVGLAEGDALRLARAAGRRRGRGPRFAARQRRRGRAEADGPHRPGSARRARSSRPRPGAGPRGRCAATGRLPDCISPGRTAA